jgi:hypothetical protein
MGLNTTSTMGSSKSFGLARGKNKVLTQYTFPAGTSTWTAPAGVTSLTSAVGKGSDGTADVWSTMFNVGAIVQAATDCGYPVHGSTLDYSTPFSEAQNVLNTVNTITTNSNGEFVTFVRLYLYYWCPSSSNWRKGSLSTSQTLRRIGTSTLSGNMPSTGTVPTPPSVAQERVANNIQQLQAGYDGSATTGFSLTFPGGTTVVTTATNTTFNNVTVTPGTTYTITNNGSLTINYFV